MKITKQQLKKLIKEEISLMELGGEADTAVGSEVEGDDVESGYHQQLEIKNMLQALLDHFGIETALPPT